MFVVRKLFIIFVLLVLMGFVLPTTAQGGMVWPTDGWTTSTPEAQGIDSEKLMAVLDFVEDSGIDLHSLTVVRNGYMVLDVNFFPYGGDMLHRVYSVVKSVNATLLGIAIEEGYIEGPDQLLLDVFSKRTIANRDAQKEAITLSDVMVMSGGLACQDETGSDGANLDAMAESDNWSQLMLDLPMAYEPGTEWTYCDGFAHLLGSAIQEASGMSPLEFGTERLFEPLGITDIKWNADPQGVNFGGDGLYLKPHDMAKFGYLFLNRGEWDGKQLVPAEWVDLSTCVTPSDCPFYELFGTLGYGYQWWIEGSEGYYLALGLGGQLIFVMPELDMVVVTTTSAANIDEMFGLIYGLMSGNILPAVVSEEALPENPEIFAQLEEQVTTLANPPEPTVVEPLPEVAMMLSGQTYDLPEPFDFHLFLAPVMQEHDLGGYTGDVVNFQLDFPKADEALLKLGFADDYTLELPVGLDGVWRFYNCRFGSLVSKGYWRTDNTFRVNVGYVDNAQMLRIDFNFEDAPMQVVVRELSTDTIDTVLGWLRTE